MNVKIKQKSPVLTPISTISPPPSCNLDQKKVSQTKGCQRCRNHGCPSVERPHKCPYKCKTHMNNCADGCGLVATRTKLCRKIKLQMAKLETEESLIDVVSTKDKTTKPNCRSHFCKKCRVHGSFERNRSHCKQCPHRLCYCEQCKLIDESRNLAAQQMKKFRHQVQVAPAPTPLAAPTATPPLPTIRIQPTAPPINTQIRSDTGGTYMVVNIPQFVNVPTLVYVTGSIGNTPAEIYP